MNKFQLDSPKKVVSASTAKQYMSKLNNIAKQGYNTPEQLLEYPEKVVAVIESSVVPENDDMSEAEKNKHLMKNRQQLCLYYSAVFYAIGEQDFTARPKTKAYYDAFRKIYYTKEYDNPYRN